MIGQEKNSGLASVPNSQAQQLLLLEEEVLLLLLEEEVLLLLEVQDMLPWLPLPPPG